MTFNGGTDASNAWIYESVEEMLEGYGLEKGCNMDSWYKLSTPFDHKIVADARILKCYEYFKGCTLGVMRFLHDGGHFKQSYSDGLTWWF